MHPVIDREEGIQFVESLFQQQGSGTNFSGPAIRYTKDEFADVTPEVDAAIESVLAEWRDLKREGQMHPQEMDGIEGQLSGNMHQSLKSLPARVLTDFGFWRFMSVRLAEFIQWRQPTTTPAAALPYYGLQFRSLGPECVPHRMFNRAHIANLAAQSGETDDYELAGIPGSDLWKSHVLRISLSYAPTLVGAYLERVRNGELKTDTLRKVIKDLNRVRSNLVFEVLEADQANQVVQGAIDRVTGVKSE